MRNRIQSIVLAAALASAPLAVYAQAAPSDAPRPPPVKHLTVEEKKAEDLKKAEAKKKAAAKKTEAKPMKKQPEVAPKAPVKSNVKQPGAGPIVEKRTVTDKGKSPFALTDKDGKPIATSPDAYDVSSATTPPKKR